MRSVKKRKTLATAVGERNRKQAVGTVDAYIIFYFVSI